MTTFDPANMPALLGEAAPHFNVDAVVEIGSTNDELSRRVVARLAASGSVLVADRQTAGRGRQGRTWSADPVRSLTFSVYWRFSRSPMAMSGLSLAVGLGVLQGLQGLGAQSLGLKWPNDLLCQQAEAWGKLGGVLIELSPGRHGVDAIIGIGLNLLPVAVDGVQTACLQEALPSDSAPDRAAVLAAVLKSLRSILAGFDQSGFAPYRAAWESAHVWQNQVVRVTQSGETLHSGRCVGVDEAGVLWLETPTGRCPVQVGDVSLRVGEAT